MVMFSQREVAMRPVAAHRMSCCSPTICVLLAVWPYVCGGTPYVLGRLKG